MVARGEHRQALRFAGLFAAAATIAWAVLLTVGYRIGLGGPIDNGLYLTLNVGGEVLSWPLRGLIDPSNIPPDSVAEWPLLLVAQFVASFVQGLAWVFMWSVWRRSRDRAVGYLLAIAAVATAAYSAGVAHFQRVNCWGNPTFDGDCDLADFDGLIWAAVAFGVALLAVVLVETLIRKASRSASRTRTNRRTLLVFAFRFAVVMTVAWIVLEPTSREPALLPTAGERWYLYSVVNVGGVFLERQIRLFLPPIFAGGMSWEDGEWLVCLSSILSSATVFVCAFVQGVVYALLGRATWRWHRQRAFARRLHAGA